MVTTDIRRRLPLVLLLSIALCLPAAAGDTWTSPFNGVRCLHRTTNSPKWDIHVAVVDLSVPGISLTATAPKDRRTTVSTFAKREKAQVAINASFFSYSNYSTVGISLGEGTVWSGTGDDSWSGQLVFGNGRVEIANPSQSLKVEPWMTGILSGHPLLVWNGQLVAQSKSSSLAQSRHPRTAVGLSKDRKKLFLLVVDGRSGRSVGMTADEEAKALRSLGAWSAVNMDGGGSSAMYIQGHGIVNRPSDGSERVVANHLGVLVGKAASAKAAAWKAAPAAAKKNGAKAPDTKSLAAQAAYAAKEAAEKSAAAKAAAWKSAVAKTAAKADAAKDAAAQRVAETEAAAKDASRKAAAALNNAAKLAAKAAAAKAETAKDAAEKKGAEIAIAAKKAAARAEDAKDAADKRVTALAEDAKNAAEKKTAEITKAAKKAAARVEDAKETAKKNADARAAAEKNTAAAKAENKYMKKILEGYQTIAELLGRFTQWIKHWLFP